MSKIEENRAVKNCKSVHYESSEYPVHIPDISQIFPKFCHFSVTFVTLSSLQMSKELVTLRSRATKDGGRSLYLDYTVGGVRTREFLKMYLVPERTKIHKLQNQETLKQAEGMKAKRILQLQEGQTGIRTMRKEDMPLTEYIARKREEYLLMGKTFNAQSLAKINRWLGKYGRKTTLLTIDKEYIMGFCHYMESEGLAKGTVFLLFSILRTVMNKAYKEGMLNDNPFQRFDSSERPQRQDTAREYLTLEEVKRLADTHCRNRNIERAFLFSCFTGLRISDIEALRWDQIRDNGQGMQIELKQTKTKRLVYLPLSANAIAQLPEGRRQGRVFPLPARSTVWEYLDHWVKKAGITKHISFHCARHTYATLLLTYGANIYTVSSLLGHTNVKTTQIYAKIVDENKRKTVDLIPDIGER